MPELPEVQTTVNGLNKFVKGLKILDVWTDYRSHFHKGKNNIKDPDYFQTFKKEVIGTKITGAERQGKNVLIHLFSPAKSAGPKTILAHMKMTGHFLYGRYAKNDTAWRPTEEKGPLRDPFNRFIRLVFTLSNGKHLVFSDLRRFGKIFLFKTANRHAIEDLMHLGPDPLTKDFNVSTLNERLSKRLHWRIKQALMDQSIISGIGNIYADETLWAAGIHPASIVKKIPKKTTTVLYKQIKKILSRAIKAGGTSDSDYRNVRGEKGGFQNKLNVYRQTGKPCGKKNCSGIIKRISLGGRGTHFCDKHQKLFR